MSGYWETHAKAVGVWDLQEQGGLTAADSRGGRDGALRNGLDFANDSTVGPTGWLPAALRMSSSSHGVEIDFAAELNTTSYSVHAWVKRDAGAPSGAAWGSVSFDPVSGHMAYVNASGVWRHWFGHVGSSRDYGDASASTDWAFLATTYDGTTSRIYLDGIEVSNLVWSDYAPNASAAWWIGNYFISSFGFGGAIAGFAIYDEVLSAAEIAELYAGPEPRSVSPPTLAGLVAAGEALTVAPGQWHDEGNGPIELLHAVQQSDNGVDGWSPVDEPVGDPGVPTPLSLAGKFLRVQEVAANLGGPSDPVVSVAYPVGAPLTPVRLAAGSSHANCAVARSVAAKTAVAGLVIPTKAA